MLTRLRVSGFKNLVDIDVRFGPFTCIAGANGVGKSNLFDSIGFLSALADNTLIDAAMSIRDEGRKATDVRSLFHRVGDQYAPEMSFQAEMIIPFEGTDDLRQPVTAGVTFLRYDLLIGYRDHSPGASSPGPLEIRNEKLNPIRLSDWNQHLLFESKKPWRNSVLRGRRVAPLLSTDQVGGRRVIQIHQDGKAGVPRNVPAENLPRSVLSAANSRESPTAVLARREMQSWRRFQLEPSSLRCPDEFSTSGHLGTDGSNLAATLYRLAKAEPGQGDAASSVYARMANRLSDLIGDVQEVWVDRDEKRGLLTVHVRENGTPHPARSLSDGTLRFLALSVLEQDPEFTGLLCLEEPENGIHPERIPAMLELLDAIAVDPNEPIGAENPLSQVIVNTHSPGVVGQVRDEDLLIAQHREYSRDNKRYKALVLRALPGTWRVTKGQAPVASRGALLSYLSPFQPRQSDSGSRGRVIDRKDLRQLLLPGLGAAS